jgi:hypothetical protein
METRTSRNWVSKPGGFDAINTRFVDFEEDYPILNCKEVDFTNIVNCNNTRNLNCNSLVSTFIDDYHLERYWNRPDYYINRFEDVCAVMSPDYTILIGMPDPMMRWQIYRNRFVGYIWQKAGINVIPTICWTNEKSFDFCFKGVAEGSIVATSSIGMLNEKQIPFFLAGFEAMIETIKPSKILFLASKKYRHLFQDERIQWLDSFFENRRKQWQNEKVKI